MNRIVSYLSQYFGEADFAIYPRSPKLEKSKNLSLAIDRANCMALGDANAEYYPDFRNL